MYKKILVAIGVIFLIFFMVKLCEKGPSEPSSFDSIYEESQEEPQEETSTYDNSDSVVTRKREYSFPEYNSDTDEIDDGNIVACGTPGEFFAGNNFYTTAANRMARRYFPMAVTGEDIVECLKKGV